MRVEFTLQGKAFSVNSAYYSTRKVLTTEAKAWQAQIMAQLEDHKDLHDFALEHKKLHGPIELRLCFNYPSHVYYNKQGQISSKVYDLDNSLKLLIDCIFRHMDINDKHISKIVAEKRVGASHTIDVKLGLL